jgi:hypothetical protein
MIPQSDRDTRRLIAQVVGERTGSVTLNAAQASTTITDPRIRYDSFIDLMPETASAAAEIANGTLFIPSAGRGNGSVTITHANGPQADRTFRYFVA